MKKLILFLFFVVFITSVFGQEYGMNPKYIQEYNVWKQGSPNHTDSYQEWCEARGFKAYIELNTPTIKLTPGDYFISGSNKIIQGAALTTISTFGCLVYVNSDDYVKGVMSGRSKNAPYIIAGLLNLVGLGVEISGFMDISKAGLSLNENGIGVKVKF